MTRSSEKQEKILAFINQYIEENGFPPAVREIGAAVGLKSTATVSYHLGMLKREGRIEYQSGKSRTISVAPAVRSGTIPIVGLVTAGQPILAQENWEGTLPWDGEPDCFALRVRGDSMVGAGIFSGDLVVVRPQPDADNGDIVVALLEDEATVKRFRRDETGVWLLPENPSYQPIDGRTARILGKVKALYREYS